MPKKKITEDEKWNYIELKESISKEVEAVMMAYDHQQEQKVLLVGSIFEDEEGQKQFVPHAQIIDLDEQQTEERYTLQTERKFSSL